MTAEDRRTAIITATIPLLRTRGWTVTTKEIGAAAQVSDGTIFSVFKTKDELLLAALQAALDPQAALDRLAQIDPGLALEERLIRAVEILQDLGRQIWELTGTLQLEEVRGRLPQRYSGDDFVQGVLRTLFEPSQDDLRFDPAVASQALMALTLSGFNPMFFKRPLQASEIVGLMLHGVGRTG